MNPETRQRINRLLAAQERMLNDWAESEPGSDDRREMWRELQDAGDALRRAMERCPSCDGAGHTPDVMDEDAQVTCPDCAGSGRAADSISVNR